MQKTSYRMYEKLNSDQLFRKIFKGKMTGYQAMIAAKILEERFPTPAIKTDGRRKVSNN
jgi:hypothetical protein